MPQLSRVDGNELEERLATGDSIADLLPISPAIYLWRRNLKPPPGALASPSAFRNWIERVISVPLASVRRRELSHYAILEGLTLGGQGLSDEKKQTIEHLSAKGRSYVAQFLQALAAELPSLYVGETQNLRERIASHVRGESGLKDVLVEDFGVSWRDVDLWFYELPRGNDESAKPLRTLLETLATKLTLAPSVRRIG